MSKLEEHTLRAWYMAAIRRDDKLNPAEAKSWARVYCQYKSGFGVRMGSK